MKERHVFLWCKLDFFLFYFFKTNVFIGLFCFFAFHFNLKVHDLKVKTYFPTYFYIYIKTGIHLNMCFFR